MTTNHIGLYPALFFFSRIVFTELMQRVVMLKSVRALAINTATIKQDQKDRESIWPIGIFADTALLFIFIYLGLLNDFWAGNFFACLGVMALTHIFVTEPIYYFYHRILHSNAWLYQHHHIYHHRSIIVDPFTAMSFTVAERLSYMLLFGIPSFVVTMPGMFNYAAFLVFYLVFDFVNTLGHFNLKISPEWYKKSPLRWLIYSPEFHEKHHRYFTTNYSLFMPIYDKIFGTITED